MRCLRLSLLMFALGTICNIESFAQEMIKVQIDFDTRSEDNVVVLENASIVSVAVITVSEFKAHKVVDDEHLLLNGVLVEKGGWGSSDHPKCSDSDVNGDGAFDLVCKLDVRKPKLLPGKREVVLTGKTLATGVLFEGRDIIDVR